MKYDRASISETLYAANRKVAKDGIVCYVFATAQGYTIANEKPFFQAHYVMFLDRMESRSEQGVLIGIRKIKHSLNTTLGDYHKDCRYCKDCEAQGKRPDMFPSIGPNNVAKDLCDEHEKCNIRAHEAGII